MPPRDGRNRLILFYFQFGTLPAQFRRIRRRSIGAHSAERGNHPSTNVFSPEPRAAEDTIVAGAAAILRATAAARCSRVQRQMTLAAEMMNFGMTCTY